VVRFNELGLGVIDTLAGTLQASTPLAERLGRKPKSKILTAGRFKAAACMGDETLGHVDYE